MREIKNDNKKQLPIGVVDFKEIIERDKFYIDKTLLIEELYTESSKVKLFTRPRRFGKTTNMYMLKYFFDIENKDENRKLFESLKISKSLYFENQGTAPVIMLSFRGYEAVEWEKGYSLIKNIISNIYNDFEWLREKLNKRELLEFDKIWLKEENDNVEASLLNLTKYLKDYYGKKVVVLIDEYDKPILEAYEKGYYKECVNFFKAFYSNVLKDNINLELGVLTGILRVAKENIFSGLNNIQVYSILSKKFTEYFGITEEEVIKALKYYNLEDKLEEVKEWYNGYLFGEDKIYNPWSILNMLASREIHPYWINTSENGLIKSRIQNNKEKIYEDFSTLLEGKSINKKINDTMTFDNLEYDYENIWSLFFNSGYLTLSKEETKKNNDELNEPIIDYTKRYNLKIPNFEIMTMFSETFIDIYIRKYNDFLDITDALEDGDVETFRVKLQNILQENIGIYDIKTPDKEIAYHMLLNGMFVVLKNRYEWDSNGLSGEGRYDIMLRPFDDRKEGIIIEIKIARFNAKNGNSKITKEKIQKELEKQAISALNQIEEKEYILRLKNAKVEKILKIGIAFYGKKVEVKYKRD